jgi:excisionase family DNA binding protein
MIHSNSEGNEQVSPKLLTAPKAAAYLGLSESRVRQMLTGGQLPTRTVGKRLMVPLPALERWLTEAATI